jgi:hypothetical protein
VRSSRKLLPWGRLSSSRSTSPPGSCSLPHSQISIGPKRCFFHDSPLSIPDSRLSIPERSQSTLPRHHGKMDRRKNCRTA